MQCQVGDPRFGLPLLGDVVMGRHRSTAGRRAN